MRKVDTIVVMAVYVECPSCGEKVEGWLSDPRGSETACDHCGTTFAVEHQPTFKFM